jgi:Alr-MurF fusion protein
MHDRQNSAKRRTPFLMITFSQLPTIVDGKLIALHADCEIRSIITDSRKGTDATGAVFFAIKGKHHDANAFLLPMYQIGVRQFVVESIDDDTIKKLSGSNILKVASSLRALQRMATAHRSEFKIPVIGITGSNAKTIIKEWLFTLLAPDFRIVKNPGSYNSQLGVPLSVWQIQPHHQLGIFEAGISRPGEMENLEKIISPTIGIFTNLGTAHDEGFSGSEEKVNEKLKLFESSTVLIYSTDHAAVHSAVRRRAIKSFSWGSGEDSTVSVKKTPNGYRCTYDGKAMNFVFPFDDKSSIENCLHCITVMIYLGYGEEVIASRLKSLRSVPMRLELKEGVNHSYLIDDTYNNDLAGLRISLEFLSNQYHKNKKRLILSDILETGLSPQELVNQISTLVAQYKIQSFIGIGPILSQHKNLFSGDTMFFESTESFLTEFKLDILDNEVILVKGARAFQFEKIIQRLQKKVHGTVMEIDLGAVVDNLNYFRSMLQPATKIMVMVKAFAYGSGSVEIANLLQYHKVDYLGVAYADEGVELRKNNITLPVMVMNPSAETFQSLLEFNLEPEIYSFGVLHQYLNFLHGRKSSVHLKLDTGMHRLGFEKENIPELIDILKANPQITVASIFSHLAGADEAEHDQFTMQQAEAFISMAGKISMALDYQPLFHILNSPGILRKAEWQFDMVRLGIGLYGVNPTAERFPLKPVATLKTTISQIKHVRKGETVGYGRRGVAESEMRIATIAIGYADGFSRAFSRGVGEVLIHGKRAAVVGNVCMDMTMVDITGIDATEGDEVIVFGKDLPIQELAERIRTIPYELLTNTSERVKRVFVAESI